MIARASSADPARRHAGVPAERPPPPNGPEIDPGHLPVEEPDVPNPDPGPQPYPVDDPPYPDPTAPDVVPDPQRPIRI